MMSCFLGCATENFDVSIGDIIEVATPLYPHFYPDNIECLWMFVAKTTGSYSITINELIFRVSGRRSDWLIIGRGNEVTDESEILRESTFYTPGFTFVVNEELIWIRFYAGNKYRRKGFSLEITRNSFHRKLL